MKQIFEKLNAIYEKNTGLKKEFDLTVVESSSAKADFAGLCEDMKLNIPSVIPFLEDAAFSVMIKEML